MNKRIFLNVIVIFSTLLLLNGCLGLKTPPEKMYVVMEEVVNAEKVFEDQQDPLVETEKIEKQIYDQIIDLGMKQYEKIVVLADEALKLSEKRKELMENETASIETSKTQFKKLKPFIEDIEKKKLKNNAKRLYNVMMERYKAHDELQQNYLLALRYDQELYELFKQKELTIEQIEGKITKINNAYKAVYQSNDNFNIQTKKYNDLKLKFYEEAGLKTEKINN